MFKKLKKHQKREIIREFLILSLCLFLVILFCQNNILTLILLTTLYITRTIFWYKPRDHTLFFVGGLIGTIIELVLTTVGIYNFANPTFFNLPIWIPISWAIGSLTVMKIVLVFIK